MPSMQSYVARLHPMELVEVSTERIPVVAAQRLFSSCLLRKPIAALALMGAGLFYCGWDVAAARAAGTLIDVIGHLPLADYNANINPQTYKDWGNEPFIAVNPVNPSQIITSGFAYSFNNGAGAASLWVSNDAGASWNTRFPLNSVPPLAAPPSANGPSGPNDQVFVYDSGGALHAAMLTSYRNAANTATATLSVYHGTSPNPNTASSFTWSANPISVGAIGTQADQPWMTISGSNVLVAYDVFAGSTSVRANRSTNNGAAFTQDLPISNGFATNVNPGLRVDSDTTGRHYAIWGVAPTNVSPGVHNVTYHLNRYTPGSPAWDFTGNATPDGAGGLVIDTGVSTQINNAATYFGGKNDLRGNITAVASDGPGNHIYTVYGKRDVNNVDRIWLSEFHPISTTLAQRPAPVALSVAGKRAALPSVAVAANGAIGVIYLTAPAPDTFEVHFAQSFDLGLTWADDNIYNYSTAGFALGSAAFPSSNRLLGDYLFVEAIGNDFYATFPGTGNVNAGGINTTNKIVPFYYIVAAIPEPASLLLAVLGGIGLLTWRRRNGFAFK